MICRVISTSLEQPQCKEIGRYGRMHFVSGRCLPRGSTTQCTRTSQMSINQPGSRMCFVLLVVVCRRNSLVQVKLVRVVQNQCIGLRCLAVTSPSLSSCRRTCCGHGANFLLHRQSLLIVILYVQILQRSISFRCTLSNHQLFLMFSFRLPSASHNVCPIHIFSVAAATAEIHADLVEQTCRRTDRHVENNSSCRGW